MSASLVGYVGASPLQGNVCELFQVTSPRLSSVRLPSLYLSNMSNQLTNHLIQ